MTLCRPFLAALTTTTLLVAAAPAVTSATPAPLTWQPAHSVTASDGITGYPLVTAGPDGAVDVLRLELHDDSSVYLYDDHRTAEGAWQAPVPIAGPDEGVGPDARAATDDHGNATVTWLGAGEIWAATRLKGQSGWTDPVAISGAGETEQLLAISAAPGGRAVVAWPVVEPSRAIAIRVRDADGAGWGPVSILDQDDAAGAGGMTVSVSRSGIGVATWTANVGADRHLRAARFSASDGSWGPVADLDAASSSIHFNHMGVAVAEDGSAVATWVEDEVGIESAHVAAASNTWSAPVELDPGQPTLLTSVTARADGRFVAVWQRMLSEYVSLAYARVFDGSQWDDIELLTPNLGGAPTIATNAGGDSLAVMISSADGLHVGIGGSLLEHNATAWRTGFATEQFTFDYNVGLPAVALDDLGNGFAAWVEGSGDSVELAVADRSAPKLNAITAPLSANAGATVNMRTSSSDLWSEVETVEWDFGDGDEGEGDAVSHAYDAPGTYTVTVTATDSAGNTKVRTKPITIIAPVTPQPPSPPAAGDDDQEDTVIEDVKPPAKKQPTVNAPVIDAKLAGKTITYSTKLTLKKGHKCTGKVQATFRYGNKRYKSNLKLKKVGNTCRATGKTTLKKTPSARTKITIKITGKHIKTRSLATKRG